MSFFKQKARLKWLTLGVQKTSFFHKMVTIRKARCTIFWLIIKGKQLLVLRLWRRWPRLLLTLDNSAGNLCRYGVSLISQILSTQITENQKVAMQEDVSELKIQQTIFNMDGDEGSCSRWLHSSILLKGLECGQWGYCQSHPIIFFRSGKLLGEVNATIFSLVPKVPNPFKIGDFQPNSCCNIVYTFITTILANRLKHCVNDLIGQILDNICPW